ncbi:hypothetical protein [Gimibacter soli]|uniref:Uncharacterized protein n=1 Tax=Gimibacter soli TaxID=3024400 RepID=A0AAF0BN37_9PROT|nr:hypothetical protein [Gimibacter soli]WCL55426.1 hypothetical protein PH603_06595 [Gimibacter soli]
MTSVSKGGGLSAENLAQQARIREKARESAAQDNARKHNADAERIAADRRADNARRSAKAQGVGRKVDIKA